MDTFGGVHVLVANAGILRDKSFGSMSEKDWDDVIAVHLRYVVQHNALGSEADCDYIGERIR